MDIATDEKVFDRREICAEGRLWAYSPDGFKRREGHDDVDSL